MKTIKLLVSLGFVLLFCVSNSNATSSSGTPAWDQTYPDSSRFVKLSKFANKAILDKNTGLVWAVDGIQVPSAYATWAASKCYTTNLNNTGGGWRLPTLPEILTLSQPNSTNQTTLSFSSKFNWSDPVVNQGFYILTTTATYYTPPSNFVIFSSGAEWDLEALQDVSTAPSRNLLAVCVRGPSNQQ